MPVRGTQSLVHVLGPCWRRPSLLAWELLWRWGFGIPTLVILYYEGAHIVARLPPGDTDLSSFSLQDPVASAQLVAGWVAALRPPVLQVAVWLAPLLAVVWAVVSGLGRGMVLKRLEAKIYFAPVTLILLQLLRIVALAATVIGWFRAIHWAATSTLEQAEPNLVAYFAWVISLSLGIFVLWALLSWIFSIAPLLAMLEGAGFFSSLGRSLRLGPLAGKLVEVNLVMGIVKLALVVLAMVLSATPLPFAADMTGVALYLWWACVTVLYLAASDFFQVARLALFVQFWRTYRQPVHTVHRASYP